MSHFYKISKGSGTFMEDVHTAPQAKKHKGVVPSVTTVLGVIKEPFIHNIYRPKKITELAREYPNMNWRDISDMVYGLRKHPQTGEMIPSSEFGTTVHKRLQDYVDFSIDPDGHDVMARSVWDDWVDPFMNWIHENNVKPYDTERVVSCNRVKIAGSVDFIGQWEDGRFFLADYKCRSCTRDIPKFYSKDCAQLAIESLFFSQEKDLDYIPECISICIDTETAKHHHKMWKALDVAKGIRIAKLCSKLYWETIM